MERRTEQQEPLSVSWAYRVALACGLIPMVAGTLIFVLWLVSRLPWLMLAGLWTMSLGLVLFVVGLTALTRSRVDGLSGKRVGWLRRVATWSLFGNFPLAAGIVWAVFFIESTYFVTIRNESGTALEQVEIVGGGCDETIGTIPSGGVRRRWLQAQRPGELELRARCGTNVCEEIIEGYVTPGMGDTITVTVNRGTAFSVVNGFTRFQVAREGR